jgi:hypothetical protein
MNNLIKYAVAILLCLTGSLLWVDNASGGKPTRVTVTTATPDNALQGEYRDVVISGSGFGHGSTVRFLVSGTNDDAQVDITGVTLFDEESGDLVVPIHVLDSATVDFYDVEVKTSSGRRGKGTDLFKVEQVGGGNVYPTFDVTFDGNMLGSGGTNWQTTKLDADGMSYWRSEPNGGTGLINLDYFRNPSITGGPFTSPRGENCFGPEGLPTQIEGVQLYQSSSNGGPVLSLTFTGTTDDEQVTFDYQLLLKGYFADPSDWLPQVSTTVTMTNWTLRISRKNLRRKYSNISCTGEGVFETIIEVERNPLGY